MIATAAAVSFLLMTPAALAFPVLLAWAVVSTRRHWREVEERHRDAYEIMDEVM